MIENPEKSSAAEALKRVLAAKRAATQDGGAFSSAAGARKSEKTMQRQAAALNKPAFRRASKRG
ncbi:hypothetical protein EGK63_08195 [Brevundimonas sp. 357]|jgi:hypothetical protein|nr:hypothetical protein [Brevundimonas diminuta]RSB46043.1 hypothetical protein EGK63_08195 [Brevundimonas sp. 357]